MHVAGLGMDGYVEQVKRKVYMYVYNKHYIVEKHLSIPVLHPCEAAEWVAREKYFSEVRTNILERQQSDGDGLTTCHVCSIPHN
jgi:hypothetical protein